MSILVSLSSAASGTVPQIIITALQESGLTPFEQANLTIGDRVRLRSVGPGTFRLVKVVSRADLYHPDIKGSRFRRGSRLREYHRYNRHGITTQATVFEEDSNVIASYPKTFVAVKVEVITATPEAGIVFRLPPVKEVQKSAVSELRATTVRRPPASGTTMRKDLVTLTLSPPSQLVTLEDSLNLKQDLQAKVGELVKEYEALFEGKLVVASLQGRREGNSFQVNAKIELE